MVTRFVSLVPAMGWGTFTHSAAVTELVWEMLATWHYMNPTSGTSIWESETGATSYLAYPDSEAKVLIEMVAGEVDETDEELDMLRERLRRDFGIDAAPG